jgi:osmotically-inducible protein OsmY
MFPAHAAVTNADEFSRCEEHRRGTDPGKSASPIQKTDAARKESMYQALWKDDVLRAIEYDEIEVRVDMGIVHLNGHIVSGTSQVRVMNAIRTVPGSLEIRNHLVLDDQLTLEVAGSLGDLEHMYECKFFTGASHGVISMDGIVRDQTVKLLAEQQVSSNPKVRGVINHVRVRGSDPGSQSQPFLQPVIGETIYFLDGIPGIVKQVVINPNDRRVIAMIVRGVFTDQVYQPFSLAEGTARLPEQQVVVPMSVVRYLTRVSGFLYIKSNERNQYTDFESASFTSPARNWVPPHPYCPNEVLFPAEQQVVGNFILQQDSRLPITPASKEQLLHDQLLENDSLGG